MIKLAQEKKLILFLLFNKYLNHSKMIVLVRLMEDQSRVAVAGLNLVKVMLPAGGIP